MLGHILITLKRQENMVPSSHFKASVSHLNMSYNSTSAVKTIPTGVRMFIYLSVSDRCKTTPTLSRRGGPFSRARGNIYHNLIDSPHCARTIFTPNHQKRFDWDQRMLVIMEALIFHVKRKFLPFLIPEYHSASPCEDMPCLGMWRTF